MEKEDMIERSIAWITRWRRLVRDHEGLPQTSEAFIKISAFRRMLPDEPRTILVQRTDQLGDFVVSVPVAFFTRRPAG